MRLYISSLQVSLTSIKPFGGMHLMSRMLMTLRTIIPHTIDIIMKQAGIPMYESIKYLKELHCNSVISSSEHKKSSDPRSKSELCSSQSWSKFPRTRQFASDSLFKTRLTTYSFTIAETLFSQIG